MVTIVIAQIGHVGEIRRAHPAGFVHLVENHLPARAVPGSPRTDAPLERSPRAQVTDADGAVASLQRSRPLGDLAPPSASGSLPRRRTPRGDGDGAGFAPFAWTTVVDELARSDKPWVRRMNTFERRLTSSSAKFSRLAGSTSQSH
jgi:hypothetical protein